jgi:FkbM family methyltransferase
VQKIFIKKSKIGDMIVIRPLYKTAGFLIKVLRYFQEKQDIRLRLQNMKRYQNLFNGNEFFEHNLGNGLKVNLYEDSVLSKIIYDGFEQEELNFIKKTLKKDDIFVDIGANVGLFSLIASQVVGNQGLVIAFEPGPAIFNRLLENISLNNLNNIQAINCGLSDELRELNFYISDNGFDAWNSFAPSADNKLRKKIKVNVSTLDEVLKDVDKSKIKLVKIDVEGWEKFVLKGGEFFFNNYSPIVMVEFADEYTFNAGYSVHEIYDTMVYYGYEWHTIKNGELIKEVKRLYYPYNNLIAIKE